MSLITTSVEKALEHIAIRTLLADSGFDAEYNHKLCRDKFKILSTVIKVNDRNLKYSRTKGFFRRKMKERFPAKKYRQRWQIESVFSRFKRRLGNALTARTENSRTAECLLRVLTYNLMVVLLTFQKSYLPIFSTEQIKSRGGVKEKMYRIALIHSSGEKFRASCRQALPCSQAMPKHVAGHLLQELSRCPVHQH